MSDPSSYAVYDYKPADNRKHSLYRVVKYCFFDNAKLNRSLLGLITEAIKILESTTEFSLYLFRINSTERLLRTKPYNHA